MLSRRLFAGGAIGCLAPNAWAIEPPPPDASRFSLHPELPGALVLTRQGAWPNLAALIAGLPPDSAATLLAQLGDESPADIDLTGLDNAPMALTTRAALLIGWAWRYRGHGWGSSVGDDAARAFAERLERARTDLRAAIAADGNDGVAYAFLFQALKGLSAVDELMLNWEAFQSVTRKPVRAYSHFADSLSRKWFGSEELMTGFARAHQSALEPASQALICQVANEMFLDRFRRNRDEALSFAAQREVIGEIGAASEAYLALSTPSDFYQANYANGHFSFYFSLIGLSDHARPYLQYMGEQISGPWTNFAENAFDLVERARVAAGLSST